MNVLSPADRKLVKRDMWLAVFLLAAGLVTIGMSLAELHAQDHAQFAQATGTPGQPLQATPAPTSSPSAPAESKPGGTRPTTPAPEPARPSTDARQDGAKAALPPAPAEKLAPPIKDKQ